MEEMTDIDSSEIFDHGAELAVLSAVAIGEPMRSAAQVLDPEDFHDPEYARLFEVMMSLPAGAGPELEEALQDYFVHQGEEDIAWDAGKVLFCGWVYLGSCHFFRLLLRLKVLSLARRFKEAFEEGISESGEIEIERVA